MGGNRGKAEARLQDLLREYCEPIEQRDPWGELAGFLDTLGLDAKRRERLETLVCELVQAERADALALLVTGVGAWADDLDELDRRCDPGPLSNDIASQIEGE